jgi:hypothetical protein
VAVTLWSDGLIATINRSLPRWRKNTNGHIFCFTYNGVNVPRAWSAGEFFSRSMSRRTWFKRGGWTLALGLHCWAALALVDREIRRGIFKAPLLSAKTLCPYRWSRPTHFLSLISIAFNQFPATIQKFSFQYKPSLVSQSGRVSGANYINFKGLRIPVAKRKNSFMLVFRWIQTILTFSIGDPTYLICALSIFRFNYSMLLHTTLNIMIRYSISQSFHALVRGGSGQNLASLLLQSVFGPVFALIEVQVISWKMNIFH